MFGLVKVNITKAVKNVTHLHPKNTYYPFTEKLNMFDGADAADY